MQMQEVDYIIKWILAGVSLIGTVVSVLAWIKSKLYCRKAKKEAEKAREYADNANSANISAKKYYDLAVQILDIEKEATFKKAIKEKIRTYILTEGMCKTRSIAELIGKTEEEAFVILEEMVRVDNSISAAGQLRIDNLSVLTWLPRSKKQ